MTVDVKIERCRDSAIIPTYANSGDAGMDVYAAEEVVIKPGETILVPIGIKFAIPVGYEIEVRPRSGLSLNTPLRIPNSPGTIDSGYRGEFFIPVNNSSTYGEEDIYNITEKGNKKGTYVIHQGERVAQILLKEVPVINFVQVDDVSETGGNRGGGFGSTGV